VRLLGLTPARPGPTSVCRPPVSRRPPRHCAKASSAVPPRGSGWRRGEQTTVVLRDAEALRDDATRAGIDGAVADDRAPCPGSRPWL